MNTQLSLGDEVRRNTARIVAQLRGLSDQPPHLSKVTLPATFFSQMADQFVALDAQVAKAIEPKLCAHCDLFVEEHQIREVAAPYLSMEQARIDRLNEGDKQIAQGMGS